MATIVNTADHKGPVSILIAPGTTMVFNGDFKARIRIRYTPSGPSDTNTRTTLSNGPGVSNTKFDGDFDGDAFIQIAPGATLVLNGAYYDKVCISDSNIGRTAGEDTHISAPWQTEPRFDGGAMILLNGAFYGKVTISHHRLDSDKRLEMVNIPGGTQVFTTREGVTELTGYYRCSVSVEEWITRTPGSGPKTGFGVRAYNAVPPPDTAEDTPMPVAALRPLIVFRQRPARPQTVSTEQGTAYHGPVERRGDGPVKREKVLQDMDPTMLELAMAHLRFGPPSIEDLAASLVSRVLHLECQSR
ncbi:hypothetical protein QBC39DRAFT_370863 [Podospora conica]|nr:hypothetical protein QBC39DRAFT_370863 [Schizothecium conicum]